MCRETRERQSRFEPLFEIEITRRQHIPERLQIVVVLIGKREHHRVSPFDRGVHPLHSYVRRSSKVAELLRAKLLRLRFRVSKIRRQLYRLVHRPHRVEVIDRVLFGGSLDNPALIVYRVRPTRVRFMREWALEYHEVPLKKNEGTPGAGA